MTIEERINELLQADIEALAKQMNVEEWQIINVLESELSDLLTEQMNQYVVD